MSRANVRCMSFCASARDQSGPREIRAWQELLLSPFGMIRLAITLGRGHSLGRKEMSPLHSEEGCLRSRRGNCREVESTPPRRPTGVSPPHERRGKQFLVPLLSKSEEVKGKGSVNIPSFHKEGCPEGAGWFGFDPRRAGAHCAPRRDVPRRSGLVWM